MSSVESLPPPSGCVPCPRPIVIRVGYHRISSHASHMEVDTSHYHQPGDSVSSPDAHLSLNDGNHSQIDVPASHPASWCKSRLSELIPLVLSREAPMEN